MSEQRPPRLPVCCRVLSVLILCLLLFGVALAAPNQVSAAPPAQADGGPLYLPQILQQSCKEVKAPTLMGAQIYEGMGFGSPYHQALLASGATWMRVPIAWSAVEPVNVEPANYQWEYADSQIALAYQRCLPLIVTIETNPSWASTMVEGYLNKVSVNELAQFVAALAERYDGDGSQDAPGSPRVLYFEMYNEPDVGENSIQVRWGDAADKYAAMLKAVYPAIKAANPQAQVVFGGIAYDFFTDQDKLNPQNNGPFVRLFFENVLKNGGGSYFDVMNFHFYPLFGPNWTKDFPKDGPGLLEKTNAVRTSMTKYGINKPIIITEAGWHNSDASGGNKPFGNDTLQVRYVQTLYTQAKAAGITMMAWWPFADVGGSYNYNSGLVTEAFNGSTTRKAAYTAYNVFAREIAGTDFVAEIKADADVQVYKFYDKAGKRTIYVAWSNPTDIASVFGMSAPYKDTTQSRIVTLIGSSATLYDAFWTKMADVTDGADGKNDNRLKISINGNPKYIIIKDN